MLILCPDCWHELKTTPAKCPKCGAHVDFYSRDYERRLASALPHADAEMRAQICWTLGSRRKRSSVPVLTGLLRDPDVVVRVAALRGLGEIGDRSAASEVEKLIADQNTLVEAVARKVLQKLNSTTHPTHPHAA